MLRFVRSNRILSVTFRWLVCVDGRNASQRAFGEAFFELSQPQRNDLVSFGCSGNLCRLIVLFSDRCMLHQH